MKVGLTKLFFVVIAASICLSSGALAGPVEKYGLSIQLEKSRKVSLTISCGKPRRDSIVHKAGVWTFTLRDGDVGKCWTDKTAKTAGPRVTHMERAEVSGHKRTFPRNRKLRVAAWIQVEPGVRNSHNTTVFQIHQWYGNCQCGPPLMMSFDAIGRLRARVLREPHKHNKFVLVGWKRENFEGRWVEIAVDIVNRVGFSDLEIFLDGKSVLKQQALIQKGGRLYFKAGIYREGLKGRTNPTDKVFMKNPTYALLD